VVVHEELFEFLDKFLAQIIHVLDVRVAVICLFNGNDVVVAFAVFLLALFAFDDANGTASQETTRKSRFIH
jgi:hypothetical protein